MSSRKPTHRAFLVADGKNEADRKHWTEIGAVWAHGKGKGFDVVLRAGLSASGRIVCMPADQPAAADGSAGKKAK